MDKLMEEIRLRCDPLTMFDLASKFSNFAEKYPSNNGGGTLLLKSMAEMISVTIRDTAIAIRTYRESERTSRPWATRNSSRINRNYRAKAMTQLGDIDLLNLEYIEKLSDAKPRADSVTADGFLSGPESVSISRSDTQIEQSKEFSSLMQEVKRCYSMQYLFNAMANTVSQSNQRV